MHKFSYILLGLNFLAGCKAPIIGEWNGYKSDNDILACFHYGDSDISGKLNIPIVSPVVDEPLLKTIDLSVEEEESGSITLEGITLSDDSSTYRTESIRLASDDTYSRRDYRVKVLMQTSSLQIGQYCTMEDLWCRMSNLNELSCDLSLQHALGFDLSNDVIFERKN